MTITRRTRELNDRAASRTLFKLLGEVVSQQFTLNKYNFNYLTEEIIQAILKDAHEESPYLSGVFSSDKAISELRHGLLKLYNQQYLLEPEDIPAKTKELSKKIILKSSKEEILIHSAELFKRSEVLFDEEIVRVLGENLRGTSAKIVPNFTGGVSPSRVSFFVKKEEAEEVLKKVSELLRSKKVFEGSLKIPFILIDKREHASVLTPSFPQYSL